MPGRTPDAPDDRGTPNGPSGPAPTDSGVCAISPSDLVGYTGNLINRVNELEQRIAELEAANVEVNQLSDLSQQIGWVDGITYMGVPGWTQTSYGTLIPPAGFTLLGSGLTMSDGNQYSAVVYDEDGVLQYGFGQVTSDGTFTAVTGASSPGGDYIILESQSTTVPLDMAVRRSSGSSLSFSSSNEISVNTSGLYLISWFIPLIITNTPSTAYFRLQWNSLSEEIRSNQAVQNNPDMPATLPGAGNQHFAGSFPMYITSGDELTFSVIGSTVISHSPGANIAVISAVKLGGV